MQDFLWLLAQASVDPGTSWSNRIGTGEIIPIFVIGAPLVVVVLALAFSLINKLHRRNAEIAFKREMLDRGLSVDEIERMLAAKSNDAKK
ncbi:MAG TPA: hypothetical protein VGI40_27620 [Pirellulaceae bacterium]|jgi:hypothetical protein